MKPGAKAHNVGPYRVFFDTLIFATTLIYFSAQFNLELGSIFNIFKAPSLYFILFCDYLIAFILGFSTSIFNHQRINMITMSAVRFILDLALIQLLNFILLKERLGVFSPEVLIFSTLTACIITISWRLFYFESFYQNKKFKIYIGNDFEAVIRKDLTGFSGTFEILASNRIMHDNIVEEYTYVVQESALQKKELQFLMEKKIAGAEIFTIRQFYEQVLRKIPIEHVRLKDLIMESGFELTSRLLLQRAKRVSDILLSIFLFGVTWPLIIIFGILQWLESPGPAFYSQKRTGKFGKVFTIYKLRSMRKDAENGAAQWAKENDSRITKVGKFTRITRIDELPQLLNVLKGEMSFIGPRPERPEFNLELEGQIPFYNLRHSVRPGLTGWAQVKYPYGASVEDAKEKLQYDLFYIKNYSLLLDFEILVKTLQVVVFGKGR